MGMNCGSGLALRSPEDSILAGDSYTHFGVWKLAVSECGGGLCCSYCRRLGARNLEAAREVGAAFEWVFPLN